MTNLKYKTVVASVAAISARQDVLSWEQPIATALVITGTYAATTNRTKIN